MIYLTAVFLASYMFNKRDLHTCMLNSIQNVKFINSQCLSPLFVFYF